VSPHTIEDTLFEIARTLDYCRTEPAFPESAGYKIGATAYIKAKRVGRRMGMDLLEWKGGKMEVVGGDWFELPTLLLDLSRLLEPAYGRVKSFTGQFNPQNVLTLQAKGAGGVLGEWSFAFTAEEAAKVPRESPERLAPVVGTLPGQQVQHLIGRGRLVAEHVHQRVRQDVRPQHPPELRRVCDLLTGDELDDLRHRLLVHPRIAQHRELLRRRER